MRIVEPDFGENEAADKALHSIYSAKVQVLYIVYECCGLVKRHVMSECQIRCDPSVHDRYFRHQKRVIREMTCLGDPVIYFKLVLGVRSFTHCTSP